MPLARQHATEGSRLSQNSSRVWPPRHPQGPIPRSSTPLKTRPKASPAPSTAAPSPSAKPARSERPHPLSPRQWSSSGFGPAPAAGDGGVGDNGLKPHQRGGERRRSGCHTRSARAHPRDPPGAPERGGSSPADPAPT